MKILLKWFVLGAWVLFAGALWQNHKASVADPATRTRLPLGLLSISRKVTESRPVTTTVSGGWPMPQLIGAFPSVGQ